MTLCYCPECNREENLDPAAGDDWGGELVAVWPRCEKCECEMEQIEDGTN